MLPERVRSLLLLTLSSLGYRVEERTARIALDTKEGERRHSVIIKESVLRVALHLPRAAIKGSPYTSEYLSSLPFVLVETYKSDPGDFTKAYIFSEDVDGPAGCPNHIFKTIWVGRASLTPEFIAWHRILEVEKALEQKDYELALEHVVLMFDLEPQSFSAATMDDRNTLVELLSVYPRLGFVGNDRWTFLWKFAGVDLEIVKEIPLGDNIPQKQLAMSLLSRLLGSPKDLRSLLRYMAEMDAEYPPASKKKIVDIMNRYYV